MNSGQPVVLHVITYARLQLFAGRPTVGVGGKVAIVGEGELTEILLLVGRDSGMELQVMPVDSSIGAFDKYDAAIIADINKPQYTYDQIKEKVSSNKILTLNLLHISRNETC